MTTIRVSFLFTLLVCLPCCLPVCFSQTTANTYVKPYNENFQYGSNLLGNRNGWNDTSLTSLVNKAGGHTIRPTLPEIFLDRYGYNIRLNEFKYYVNNLGMKEITCFIQQPSPAHADNTIFPGCTQPSKLFANLYQPIWNANGTVNTNNYYANYVYKLLQTYGPYVKFWEVVNEPDLTIANTNANNWLIRAPFPYESVNMQAPIYYYIRTLRITWEVVKKYMPNSYVTTGGIGSSQYLDALLRYTDNPVNGSVTAAYPNKGGAWFDVVSYHCYPGYYLRYWDNAIHAFKYTRNSDFAAAKVIDAKNAMQNVLSKYGYNGVTYPKKHFIVTETNISRRTSDWRYGSDTMQRNFGMKALVLAQKNNIKQLYFYTVGEQANAPSQSTPVYGNDEYFLMGLYENLFRDAPGTEKLTQLGKGLKTATSFLYGCSYDSIRTKALSLPANVEGGAFVKNGKYVYVLWAKDPVDRSENFTANYSFPSSLNTGNLLQSAWDYSSTGLVTTRAPVNITLTASPSFFRPDMVAGPKSQVITWYATPDKVYSTAHFDLYASASSGLPLTFKKIHGKVDINGRNVSITGVSTVIIEASQEGNADFLQAVARDTFVVNKALQTINFPAMGNKIFESASFLLQATASSGLSVTYNVVAGPAKIAGNKVKLNGTGVVTIKAAQNGNDNYLAATPVLRSFLALPLLNIAGKPGSIDQPAKSLLDDTRLQIVPNPVLTNAVVNFQVAKTCEALVTAIDMQGRNTRVLYNGTAQAGVVNILQITSTEMAPGEYIITLKTPEKSVSKKMIVLK